ncbi:MAG: ABC transporter ATP-binding protein [Candidatus Riflebacteria bacterium]|nr:ABC transporter ATP-binding protein [Candidatus Riflebacteria bacterium]
MTENAEPFPLVVEDLKKAYISRNNEELWAVNGISFEIHEHECFGLLGPNGAGKSTSMNCITGFYPATGGRVRVLGFDPHTQPRQARMHLGICSQDDTLDTDFSVTDQMIQYATYFGFSRSEAEKRSIKLIDSFKLSDKRDKWVEELSGGMRRRLQVARALVSDPKLLVLDEPTTGLDPEVRRFLWNIIEEFRGNGGAVLVSTHYIEEAERLCDRVAIMFKGRILDCDTPRNLIAKYSESEFIEEEVRPGLKWKRPSNLEDVYLRITGTPLSKSEEPEEKECLSK